MGSRHRVEAWVVRQRIAVGLVAAFIEGGCHGIPVGFVLLVEQIVYGQTDDDLFGKFSLEAV